MRIAAPFLRFLGPVPDTVPLIRYSACLLAILLAWLGWGMVGSRDAIRDAAQQTISVTALRGRIAYFHERSTMSARMAAATGDPVWVERFEAAVPMLEAVIAQAAALATSEARVALTETLLEAHHDLLLMERRALTLVAEGDLKQAAALLDGAEFNDLQDVYGGGMETFGRDLEGSTTKRAEVIGRRTWLRSIAFGLTAILLVTIAMAALQRIRLRDACGIDALTQLPNRRRFYGLLSARLERRPVLEAPWLALTVIGIDHFKGINDSFGHAVADQLLQLVTARLRATTCPGIVRARVGGDEFALVLEAPPPRLSEVCSLRPIMAALAEPYRLGDGRQILLGFSAGVVWIGSEELDVGDAMRQADAALRQAKADGRGRLRVFDHAMDEKTRDQAKLGADLRSAIDRHDIVPFFQPLVDLDTGRVVGVETLARWHHPERGWVSPADFIPLAEELGLIDALMHRLLHRACLEALPWPDDVTVAFNVSPLQLRDEALPDRIRAILAETGFPARRLEIEVTESALVTDLDMARGLLEDLRRSGVRLALDDFGTGYSSLNHLRCLPFDTLKIDKSFVGGMVDDRESGKIVAAVIGLGHSMGLSTVAEGVETAQVAALLRDLGCDIGQGWLYGRPVPAGELGFLRAVTLVA